jgi:hypothetical protein
MRVSREKAAENREQIIETAALTAASIATSLQKMISRSRPANV